MAQSSPHQRPAIAQVHDLLRRHHGLIVHFSGAPKGSGADRGFLYPADLHHVIAGQAMGGISCSVVKPTDVFAGQERNATGCVGVIVGLTTPHSIAGAAVGDAGSIELKDGRRVVDKEVCLSADDLEATIAQRPAGRYNEWVMRDFKVLGILAVPPFDVMVLGTPVEPPDLPEWMRTAKPFCHPWHDGYADGAAALSDSPCGYFPGRAYGDGEGRSELLRALDCADGIDGLRRP